MLLLFALTLARAIASTNEVPRMTPTEIAAKTKEYLSAAYPHISVTIQEGNGSTNRPQIIFTEEKFAVLYPMQRYHYLIHSLPKEFFDAHLSNLIWVELAPGERASDLRYPDENLMKQIGPDVLRAIARAGVCKALDDLMSPVDPKQPGLECQGDFRLTKRVLREKGFKEAGPVDEVFDICHVLMQNGAYCDCEVLYNAAEENRLKAKYWKERAGKAQQGGGHVR
ncbi:MAG: DUF2695 domain-containing protein [bacterium]